MSNMLSKEKNILQSSKLKTYIILKTDDFDQASFFFKRIIKIEAHLNQNFLTLINRFFNTVTVAGSRFVIVLFLGLKSILY